VASTAVRPVPRAQRGELSHRQILTILSGLMLGMFLASLDQTIVATAIKTIGNDLNGLSAQAWVTTGSAGMSSCPAMPSSRFVLMPC